METGSDGTIAGAAGMLAAELVLAGALAGAAAGGAWAQDALTIAPDGRVGIGTAAPAAPLDVQAARRSGTHPGSGTLDITGKLPAGRPAVDEAPGIEFRHSNGSQGIGFGYNTIYATGTNGDQALQLQAMPRGRVRVLGDLDVTGGLSGPVLESVRAALRTIAASLVPVGTIVAYGGNVDAAAQQRLAGAGWVLCDGRALRRADYPELFAAIGTAHGAPNSASFNAPDLRGRFLRGVDMAAGKDPDAGQRVANLPGGATGDAVGSYQADIYGAHSHREYALGDHARGGIAGGPTGRSRPGRPVARAAARRGRATLPSTGSSGPARPSRNCARLGARAAPNRRGLTAGWRHRRLSSSMFAVRFDGIVLVELT